MDHNTSTDAWIFWQHSKTALNHLDELMQQCTTHLARTTTSRATSSRTSTNNSSAFQENFNCLVHATRK